MYIGIRNPTTWRDTKKDEVCPAQAMKAYRRSKRITSLVFNLGASKEGKRSASCPGRFNPGKTTPVTL